MIATARDLAPDLAMHPRVAIAGGPRTGKSTLAVRAGERYARNVRHADSLVGTFDWSAASAEVADWFDEPGEWIVEGVSVPRALRKWLASHPGAPFPGVVVWLRDAIQVQSRGAESMHKGCVTVWTEILPELMGRGALIIDRDGP